MHLPTSSSNLISITPASGPTAGGTSAIGGAAFGVTGVTFDSIAATGVTVVNDTTITASTPAHTAAAVDVAITTPNGTATGTGAYSYGLAPSVISVSPSQGPTSGGTSVTIHGTNLVGATDVKFVGVSATDILVTGPTTITAKTPAYSLAGLVDVYVYTPNGTAIGSNKYTYTIPLTEIGAISGTTQVGSYPNGRCTIAIGCDSDLPVAEIEYHQEARIQTSREKHLLHILRLPVISATT